MGFTGFIDITGANFSNAPLVKGDIRAGYVTGSLTVQWTATQIADLKAAGMGFVRIDQSPSLSVFAAGGADVADVETDAGTVASADAACAARRALGLTQHTFYVSYESLSALQSSFTNQDGVVFWVADYSWSVSEAEGELNAASDWVAVQYGDPTSNPSTLVPGTNVTLATAQADIDVAKTSWADQFLPQLEPALVTPTGLSETIHSFVNFGWGADPNADSYHFQIVKGSRSVVDDYVTTSHATASLPPGNYAWRVAADATSSYRASQWSALRSFTVDQ